jgi:flagellar motor component MotA
MDSFSIILGILGSTASIIGLIITVVKRESLRNKVLFFIITLLTIFTAITSYNYAQVTNEKLKIEERIVKMKNEAKKMYNSTYINYWSPGGSEGLAFSLLFLLEENKDIYPEMYDKYQKNVISKIEKANNENDMQKKREQMEIAGETETQKLFLIAK